MEYLRRFLKKDEENRSFPLISSQMAEAKIRKGYKEAFSLTNTIVTVDFSQVTSFADPIEASLHVVSLTSDGENGTLTHLMPGVDIKEYADQLKNFHQHPASVCLVGGVAGATDSMITNLYNELIPLGFVMPSELEHADTGGFLIDRYTTLFADKVLVERDYYSGPKETVQLSFPEITVALE